MRMLELLSAMVGREEPLTLALKAEAPPAAVQRRGLTWEQAYFLGEQSAAAGVSVSHRTASGLSAVWTARSVISAAIAVCPRILYVRQPDGSRVRSQDRIEQLVNDEPNARMTGASFWRTMADHITFWGNGYAEIQRDNAERPVALWPVRPDSVEPFIGEDDELRYRITNGPRALDARNLLHFPGLSFDGVRGYSIIQVARQSLGLGLALDAYASSFFGQGAWPGVVLTHPKRLSDTAEANLKVTWNQLHKGPDKAHGLAVLEEGMSIEKIGIPPNDAQFLESRQHHSVEVARWFNVPPWKLHIDVGQHPGGTPEAQQLEFVQDTLLPYFVIIEQELNRKLLPRATRRGRYFEHLAEALLRADTKTRIETLAKQIEWSMLTPDEARIIENRQPVEGGAVAFRPSSIVPLTQRTAPTVNARAAPRSRGAEVERAARAVTISHFGRYVRRHVNELRRAAKKDTEGFAQWVDAFHDEREERVFADMISPALALECSLVELVPRPEILTRFASAYMGESRDELLGLPASTLGESAERLARRWEIEHAAALAARLEGIIAAECASAREE